MKKVYNVQDKELTDVSIAFVRARNADPMCSYGDFIAISHTIDEPTAKLISIEVSDGIIAPNYTELALEILKKKKGGNYIILQSTNTLYQSRQVRELYGLTLVQEENEQTTTFKDLTNVVTKYNLTDQSKIDLIVANVTLKYTQSNSVAYALNGQCIGIGAGQQSRIDCVKLARRKVETWYLRQHPKCLALFDQFKKGVKRQQKVNAIVQYIENDFTDSEYSELLQLFKEGIDELTLQEKQEFIGTLTDVSLASDAFCPYRDNIDVAAKAGVKYIIQPGGSIADDTVIKAADEHGMAMVFTGSNMRMFLH